MKDYYEILNVPTDANIDDIKKAYKAKALKFHPDRLSGQPDVSFYDINEAYTILSNDELKREYDKEFSEYFLNNDSNFVPVVSENGEEVYIFTHSNQKTTNNIAESVVEAEFFYGDTKQFSNVYSFDVEPKFTISSFVQAVTIDDLASDATLVKFPAKLWHGAALKVKIFNFFAILKVNIKSSNKFEIYGSDIHYKLNVFPWEIALRRKITIPFLECNREILLSFSDLDNKSISFDNLGCFDSSGARGAFIIHAKLIVPTATTDIEKNAWSHLEQSYKKH